MHLNFNIIFKMFKAVNNSFYQNPGHLMAGINDTNFTNFLDDSTNYESDEFRMYGFKIKRCPKMRSHDWTLCPFAHPGERAERRDPRRYNYAAIACPDFRNGYCKKGENCQFAHGIFEYWLHPAKYRTRACNASGFCERKVCFFAHSPAEIRPETKYKWQYNYRTKPTSGNGGSVSGGEGGSGGGGGGGGETKSSGSLSLPVLVPVPVPVKNPTPFNAETEFRRSLTTLNTKETTESTPKSLGCDLSDFDFPNIDWIAELLE
ncbi:hypothetical protein F0562_031429 [Nyssa sinensis]|uniref:C3H1-type domain-containing protein n=1 Tax=Nyssa sinensis TaxID=561372 RepID=A0A5J5AVW3_9ASTE|nr:hypothetical protein F0562_031429 [Nyssa sinensis]